MFEADLGNSDSLSHDHAGYKVFGYATKICQGTNFQLPPASCHG